MAANELGEHPEFEFWDFVSCAVCHLPFAPPDRGPPPVPFWITECGHVLCNAHLNPDQSCAKCGDQGVQLVPLQRNIDPPMSDWFRFLPHAIDGMANAVKFQQESLAALVRHYRHQCLQLSSTCDRLRNERRSLKMELEALRRDLHLCRSRGIPPDHTREPSTHINHNGKRPMADTQGQNSSVKTNSSPRSIPTPVGPLRLTLPPGEHPAFTRQDPSAQQCTASFNKLGTSRFADQFAYHEADHSQARPSQSMDERSAPPQFDTSHMMPPPPPPAQGKRFKPMAASGQAYSQPDQGLAISTSHNLGLQRIAEGSETMRPPSTPQRPFSAALRTASRLPIQSTAFPAASNLKTNRFVPNSSHGQAVSGGAPAVSSAAMAAASNGSKVSGGNRTPFMPQRSNGFG